VADHDAVGGCPRLRRPVDRVVRRLVPERVDDVFGQVLGVRVLARNCERDRFLELGLVEPGVGRFALLPLAARREVIGKDVLRRGRERDGRD